MKVQNSKSFFFLIFAFCISPAFAGGPFVVNTDGTATTWDTSTSNPIVLNPEAGACASFTNEQMLSKLEDNVAEWSAISGINLSFSVDATAITVDATGAVLGSNSYTNWYTETTESAGFNDGINPVFFDETGAIVDAIFGDGSKFGTLGGAGPDSFDSEGRIIGGEAIFNCRCLPGNSLGLCNGGIVFSEDDLNFTMVHEIGHMIGLDHTQVNQAIADAAITEASNEDEETSEACSDFVTVDGASRDCDDIPTMYPVSIYPSGQLTPSRDDQVIMLTLYGVSTWDSTLCTITGSLTDSSGNPLRCADVHAETDDPADTIAIVSGAFASTQDLDGDSYSDGEGECLSGCGDFVLRGLDSAKSYTITVYPIDEDWVGASSISPCGSETTDGGQLTGIVEEQIGTSVSCVTGGTVPLGALTTTSTGGVSSGDSGGDSSDDSASGLSCSLHASASAWSFSWPVAVLLLSFFYGLLGITRQQFLENHRPIR